MVVFATADGLAVLLLARILQGLATGAALGAIGAGLVDLHPRSGPRRQLGRRDGRNRERRDQFGAARSTAAGSDELVYVVLAVVFLIQAAAVALIAETSPRAPGARRRYARCSVSHPRSAASC